MRRLIRLVSGSVSYAYIAYARSTDKAKSIRADLRVIGEVASCIGAIWLFVSTTVGGLKAFPQALVVAVLFVAAVWITLIT